MAIGVFLYRLATFLLTPFARLMMARRVAKGKEDGARIDERFARKAPPRPDGRLIWLHGASVGESLLLCALANQIAASVPGHHFLFTCQTQTGARQIRSAIAAASHLNPQICDQLMAPLDLPHVAKRFVAHWRPDLTLIAEGDIWPNLLCTLKRSGHPAALVNARMTENSIVGWGRWPRTAERVFSSFDVLIASDLRTKTGLSELSKQPVTLVGNLKSALPPPAADETELQDLRAAIGERPVLVAASTHEGEEAIIIDTLLQMSPRPFAIIAPRHPERGDWVESLLNCTALSIARRSNDEPVEASTDVLLADTLGEMGLWYRLADTVYLGGGHAPGVGGHNPMEPLRLGKPILTGPSLFNFQDMSEDLLARGLIKIVETPQDIVSAFPAPPVNKDSLRALEQSARDPMNQTLALLAPLLQDDEKSA